MTNDFRTFVAAGAAAGGGLLLSVSLPALTRNAKAADVSTFTAAAGIVLTVAPSLIPSVVGIHLEPSAYVLAYLLAGAEFGLAVLSFGGSRLTDSRALRLIAWSCIAFHGSSGVLEVYAYARGASVAILGNVVRQSSLAYLPTCRGIKHSLADHRSVSRI